ncbi:MAG TPA: hypothetical protein VF210_04060 [Pseudomonadales bacterium]
MTRLQHAASFRDPSGFVFSENGILYRQVNREYQPHYDRLMSSGLYDELVRKGWLVPHDEVDAAAGHGDAYRILRPERIPYISYPYEWCFSQLRAAALLTLDIQILSLARGMTLKDASAYNIQFIGCRPVFIDTLSFETYDEGTPWVAYRQFCQHFLAPLALTAHVDGRLRRLLTTYVDGIPLDLASSLLPARTRLRPGLLAHIHMHASSQRRHQDAGASGAQPVPSLSKPRLLALLENLRATVQRCAIRPGRSTWSHYYEDTNYSTNAMEAKASLVRRLVDLVARPGEVIHDIGANTGRFSRLLAGSGRYVVSHDIDELAVERNFHETRAEHAHGVLPLVLDLANPSPSIGWALDERMSALERLQGGTVVALALVHHLAIGNNVPLPQLADLFGRIARGLVIEFVPREDSQVRRLLATRRDIFGGYTVDAFEHAFRTSFDVVAREDIPGTCRTLFAMRRRE